MWKDPDPDPGGNPPESAPKLSRQLSDLKDENEQQKVLIAQLKEMLRKEQSNVSQEKIDEYVKTLKKVTAKKSRGKKGESSTTERHVTVESGVTDKLSLLKQQLEQNKARLAERGKSQKGIEDMVLQIKAELDDSQQLINATPMLLVDPKTLDYSKTTNPEELYNILLLKEQKITELMSRSQRQEAKIIDLQENLKEKDSVIDARTKAITLMTDSLSKKGKTTLDALDETKEQMRKMQENFITLESEMKARQIKLLEDLKAKNLEINELKELNEDLSKGVVKSDTQNSSEFLLQELKERLELSLQENETHQKTISNLENQLEVNLKEIKILKNTELCIDQPLPNDEVNKLKKQLEESNKNMIKIKAQSKSRMKDLTKKLETFKKMSDPNALIIQLQNENTSLSEKVAELEEEKGNLQLNMVESSDSVKDAHAEENKQLQNKITLNLEELSEKDKVISLLEAEILSLKEEISSLTSHVSSLSHLENAQVSSEMKSIQIEEQLDQLETENKKLKEEIDNLQQQKKEFNDKIEELAREKQELNTKLDNYIQENMDLIDKLEKLSAEKVSSAESIEIVEGLTQQEKLELAAYQKSIDINLEEPIKPIEYQDDTMEAPPELNEAVHQLTEDSAELLRKIEMFNAERKEVMSKMEALKDENNTLSLKLQEIENNRDILADTYEHLQTEKEEILKEKEQLEDKLKILESELENIAVVHEDSNVSSQLHTLQTKYDKLLQENDSLQAIIKDFDNKILEKHEVESQFIEYRNKIENLETKLQNSCQELINYEAIIDDNKNELIRSSNAINNLEVKLNHKETEINELNILINDLNNVVNNLQTENEKLGNFELMEIKFEELKSALNTQIEEARDYADEVEHNKAEISELNEKLTDMNRKILETEHEMEMKYIEIEKMKQELIGKDDAIKDLQGHIKEKDEQLKLLTSEMKEKYLALQKQLDGNNDSLEQQVKELTTKNKEQLEKMKKIAANLKKKTQAHQELEEKYHGEKEKWETESKEKESLICQVKDLTEELDEKTKKLRECMAKIKELTDVVQNLEQDLENLMIEMRRKQEKLNEVNLKQELSTSLHEEFDQEHGTNDSTNEDKIKELELIIETNDSELSHYKGRLQKLEVELEKSLEYREEVEKKAVSLEIQLTLLSKNAEEKTLLEEELRQKLQQVSDNDDILTSKMKEINAENNELTEKLKDQEELINKLKVKLKKSHEKVTQLKSSQQALEKLEITNSELQKQIGHMESVCKHTQEENECLQKRSQNDYEKLESDYQIQLEELVSVRNELMVECEKLKEDLKCSKDKEGELLEEILEQKLKTEEFDKLSLKVGELAKHVEEVTTNRDELVKQIEFLNETLKINKLENENLQKQLLERTAQEVVGEVVSQAKHQVVAMNTKETQTETESAALETSSIKGTLKEVSQEGVPTFHWSDGKESTPDQPFNIEQTFVKNQNPFNTSVPTQPMVAASVLDLESQILSESGIVDNANNVKNLQEIEFEKVHPSFGEQSQPVVEEVMQPKHAYLTYQPGVEAFGENDDGWGWGPEESRLEEEHQHQADSNPQVQNLKRQLEQVTEKLQVLQMERENHLEEIKQLQVKSGKLIKKCKELKAQNHQLLSQNDGKKSTDEFFDLNDTIQDELKSQITQLEKRIKDITAELEKEKAEKKNILTRVDVLTAASDKMLEMKEIQDTEVLRWKRKYEEVEEKIQQYEWGSDGFSERPSTKQSDVPLEDPQTVEELQKTIKELSLDNEELQSLLNEQRELRIQAEKSKPRDFGPGIPPELENKIKMLEHELIIRNGEIQAVLEEKSKLIDSLQVSMSEKEKVIESLEEELFSKTQELEETTSRLKNILTSSELLKADLQEKTQAYLDVKQSFEKLNTIGNNIADLKQCLAELKEEKFTLETVLNEKDNQLRDVYNQLNNGTNMSDLEELKFKLQQCEHEKNQLQLQFNDKNSMLDQLRFDVDALSSKLIHAEESKAHLEILIKETVSTLEDLKSSKDSSELRFKEEIAHLSQYKEDKIQLDALVTEKDAALNEYKTAYDQVITANENLSKQNQSLNSDIEELKTKTAELQEENRRQLENLEQLNLEKSNSAETLEAAIKDMKQESTSSQYNSIDTDKLLEELTTLKIQKQEMESEVERLKFALDDKQREFELILADVENKWVAQVDERGNNVAESWKYHLSMVESEFAAVQEKLKNEVNELEEKCNALVNENNELRKNVDAEIRNEVDRISALQHQINDKQQSVNELSHLLNQEQQENKLLKERLATMGDINEKEEEIKRLKFVVETTQEQFNEKRVVLEEIVKILEKFSSEPITLQKEDILKHMNERLCLISVYEQRIENLGVQIEQLINTANAVNEREIEIASLKQTIEQLHQGMQQKDHEINTLNGTVGSLQALQTSVHDKDGEIFRLNEMMGNLQAQLCNIQDKDIEITNLKQSVDNLQRQLIAASENEEVVSLHETIENYKKQIDQLHQKITLLEEEKSSLTYYIEDSKRQVEESLHSQTTLQNTIEQQNQQIQNFNKQLQQFESFKYDSNKDIETLHKELSELKQNYEIAQKHLAECQQQLFTALQELSEKAHALNEVTQQLRSSQQTIEILENQLLEARQSLELKEHEYANSLETLKKSRLHDVESHYEKALSTKALDLGTAQAQLQESLEQNRSLVEKLVIETQLKQTLETKVTELEQKVVNSDEKLTEQLQLMEEEEKQINEMRGIIEEQVVKIEELKKELFVKSNDYDSLVAEMDMGKQSLMQQQITQGASASKPSQQIEADDLSEPVNRAELDLALYLLHQRDVRCEELTVELTQLLEERDTLQLRLSNAIREKEELRRKIGGTPEDIVAPIKSSEAPSTPTRSKSTEIFLSASGAELATEASEITPLRDDLANKLSELKMVGYKKDKTFVDEQQLRRLQEISTMHQHLKEAAKLPPEAAAKLVDANYTLSRDVQSPSKVILNWLWGRSTPRQNDT